MKAIDIMFNGQIICLINAETLKNPHTNLRKELVKRLKDLGAKIEYLKDAFATADRKTNVEVAMVHIKIERQVEDHLYNGMKSDTQKK